MGQDNYLRSILSYMTVGRKREDIQDLHESIFRERIVTFSHFDGSNDMIQAIRKTAQENPSRGWVNAFARHYSIETGYLGEPTFLDETSVSFEQDPFPIIDSFLDYLLGSK